MKAIFGYIIELNFAITLFYMAYLLLFRKDSNFNARRIYLLFAMVASVILPVISINTGASAMNFNSPLVLLPELVFYGEGATEVLRSIRPAELLMSLYLLISLFFMGKLLASISRILITAVKSEKKELYGTRVMTDPGIHASSFFNMIFIDPDKCGQGDLEHIISHESFHARLGHSFDRILAELIMSVSWINPVSWMMRRSIVVNHEYQADNRVIEHGTDHVSYQLTILNQYIGSASITNQFSSQTKNRIIMINKNYKKGSFWKGIVLVPVSIVLLFFIACGNEGGMNDQAGDELHNSADNENTNALAENMSKSTEEQIFFVVEEMPQWPGEDDMVMAMRNFIAKNLAYPDIAKQNNGEGKVFVHFMVTKSGDVVVPDPSILPPEKDEEGNVGEVVVVAYRPLDADQKVPDDKVIAALEDEAVRVIELMPDLVPGKQRGQNVNVMFTMPIVFKMQ